MADTPVDAAPAPAHTTEELFGEGECADEGGCEQEAPARPPANDAAGRVYKLHMSIKKRREDYRTDAEKVLQYMIREKKTEIPLGNDHTIRLVTKKQKKALGKKAILAIVKTRTDEQTYSNVLKDMEVAAGVPTEKKVIKICKE